MHSWLNIKTHEWQNSGTEKYSSISSLLHFSCIQLLFLSFQVQSFPYSDILLILFSNSSIQYSYILLRHHLFFISLLFSYYISVSKFCHSCILIFYLISYAVFPLSIFFSFVFKFYPIFHFCSINSVVHCL